MGHIIPTRGQCAGDKSSYVHQDAGLNNGFWYASSIPRFSGQISPWDTYDVPTEIGRFDVVTLGAILQHLRDPLGALENAMSFTDQSIIITDSSVFIRDDLQHLPLAYFAPPERLRTPHGGWTWWEVTAEVYVRFLELKGWRVISKAVGSYEHTSGPRMLHDRG